MSEAGVERHRNPKGRWVKGQASIERDAEAFRLRSRGWTFQAISDELGYGGEGNVRRAIREATAARTAPAVDELRATMDEQLDNLWRAALGVLERKHLRFHQGVAINHDGEPVFDDTPVLNAVKVLLDVQERRARLWGTDVPVKQELEVTQVKFTIEGSDDV